MPLPGYDVAPCQQAGGHVGNTRHTRAECPMETGPTVKVTMSRHYSVRRHSTWTAQVPLTIVDDRTYFDDDGQPTSVFDQWMCDNGEEYDVEHNTCDEDDLDYEISEFGTIVWTVN